MHYIAEDPNEQRLSRLFALQALCLAGDVEEVQTIAGTVQVDSSVDRIPRPVRILVHADVHRIAHFPTEIPRKDLIMAQLKMFECTVTIAFSQSRKRL